MGRIFISYRRADSAGIVGRIYDHLSARFGSENVVLDVDTIPAGADFEEFIFGVLNQCVLELVIVGPQWQGIADESGRRRLDDPKDVVRLEIRTAINRGIPVIPILVGDVTLSPDVLPSDIAALARQGFSHIGPGRSFGFDIDLIAMRIERTLHLDPPATKHMHTSKRRTGSTLPPDDASLLGAVSAYQFVLAEVLAVMIATAILIVKLFVASRPAQSGGSAQVIPLASCFVLLFGLVVMYSCLTSFYKARWVGFSLCSAGWALIGWLLAKYLLSAFGYLGSGLLGSVVSLSAALVAVTFAAAINRSMFLRLQNFDVDEVVTAMRSDWYRSQRRQRRVRRKANNTENWQRVRERWDQGAEINSAYWHKLKGDWSDMKSSLSDVWQGTLDNDRKRDL